MGEAPEESARCGVAKLKTDGGESTKLPYTMMGGAKWVPLAYFEGEVGLTTIFYELVPNYYCLLRFICI